MKLRFLLIFLCAALCGRMSARAAETEPNDTKAQANVLALNGSNNGKINPAADVDWWKVTTNGDGKLSISLTPLSGRYTYIYLYDNNGTILLNSAYSSGAFTLSADGLAAGTYFIKVNCYYNTDTGSYTISNTLTKPVQANDAEPNATRAQALTLDLNSGATGHIGYYYNNVRDTFDWYKVTTTGDGKLRLRISSYNGQNVWAYLFDNDGTTQLNAAYTTSSVDINTDGLAAGTYYVRINNYYPNSEYAPYKLEDSLFVPTQTNDLEPNGTKAQAKVLPLNGNKTGHIGYYFDHLRDTFDWYKVVTTGDGRLRLRINSYNGQNVWAYLFDADGTTQLNANYTTSSVDINTDGLAAGTYYVRVNTYYTNSEYAPYKLEDSLFVPAQANDPEPNGNKATAVLLPVNSSKTGHIGYYNNHLRDTFDWYKVTLPADGRLRLRISSYNGQNVWAYLFDNDGTTQLNANYTTSSVDINTDGLAAGTYYVRVNNYYVNSEYATYKLEDSLFKYTNTADSESNAKPYLAKTLPANTATPGHVGFYYKNTRDTVDWWRINYTGSGALSVTLNLEPTQLYGGQYTYLQVYKDTNAAPIFSDYTTTGLTASLTALTQGYYWVRVLEYYNGQFEAYTLTPAFTQVNKARITLVSSVSAPDCSSTNSLTLKCSGSKPPYSVQLIRFGVNYGTPRTVTNFAAFTFSNLPYGVYTAKVFGDGATGTAFTKLTPVTLAAVPTNLTVTNITGTQAKLNWTAQTCVSYYTVQYRKLGDTAWTTKNTVGSVSSYLAKPLTVNTSYEWHVAPTDSANGVSGTGTYSVLDTFTTAASLMAAQSFDESLTKSAVVGTGKLFVYPNPAATSFTIQYSATKSDTRTAVLLKDINGTTVWSKVNVPASSLSGTRVAVGNLANGIYFLQIIDKNTGLVTSTKVVVAR